MINSLAGLATSQYRVTWIVDSAYGSAYSDRSRAGKYSWFRSSNGKRSFTDKPCWIDPLEQPTALQFDLLAPNPYLTWVKQSIHKEGY